MSIKLFDNDGIILHLCSIAESQTDSEQAFLVYNETLKHAGNLLSVKLTGRLNLRTYEDRVTIGSVRFAPRFFLGSIRLCQKLNMAFMLAHTHPNPKDGISANFSPNDVEIEHLFVDIAKREHFHLPLIFVVCGFASYAIHIYDNGELIQDSDFIFPFDRVDGSKVNIHIFWNKEVGAVYSAN